MKKVEKKENTTVLKRTRGFPSVRLTARPNTAATIVCSVQPNSALAEWLALASALGYQLSNFVSLN